MVTLQIQRVERILQTHKKTTRFFAEPGSEHPLPCDDRLHQNCAHGGRNAVLVRNLTLATKPTRTTLQVPAREETVSVCKRTKYCQTCLALRALRLCYVRHGHQRRAFRITRSCVWLSSQAQLCSWDHCTMNRHVNTHTPASGYLCSVQYNPEVPAAKARGPQARLLSGAAITACCVQVQAVDILRQIFGLLAGSVVNSSSKISTAHMTMISSTFPSTARKSCQRFANSSSGVCRLPRWSLLGHGHQALGAVELLSRNALKRVARGERSRVHSGSEPWP